MRNLLFLLSSIFILLGNPTVSKGYFRVNSTQEMGSNNTQKELHSSDLWSNTFVVYDNLFANANNSKQKDVLLPFCEDSLSIYKINIGTPFFKVSRISFKNEFTLESLLYANLKLKMLIDENNAHKKETSKLLKDMTIPFLDNSIILPKKSFHSEPDQHHDSPTSQEIIIIKDSLRDQRSRYSQVHSRINKVTGRDAPKKKSRVVKRGEENGQSNDLSMQPEWDSGNGVSSDSVNVENANTDKEGYAVVISRNKKKGIIAHVLIWLFGIYDFVINEPLLVIIAFVVFMLFISLVRGNVSNSKN